MTRESNFDAYIKRLMEENEELLKALGSDYDEEGVPYWEKWGKKALDKDNENVVE
jgi:hypothetical protein